ncbi:myb-like protein J [Trifolium pratense]|uniref:myb-like protein J n=1 Tax=Trifolium pratense TaxID=57577 RepID=UPI001E693C84|nr:myb-like protein J [Trifolium pratense]
MQKNSEINLNEPASIQELSENNSMEQQQKENLDNIDVAESGSNAIVVNSNANNGLIQDQLLPEENQAVANNAIIQAEPLPEENQAVANNGINHSEPLPEENQAVANNGINHAEPLPEENQAVANNGINHAEPLPEENQAVANRERKERIPWTEDEHRLFLQGLNKHGRARWKDISKDFLPRRTPTQIASHAQKYFKHLKEVAGKERKKRRSIHDVTVDNNVTVASHPIEQQTGIPLIEQQNEIPNLISPSIEQQIPSIEGQNKISTLVTHPVEKQNVNISPHSTTLNDNNIENLVTPPIEPFKEKESQLKLGYTFTVEITPQNMKNVLKVCELLEKNLKS